LNLKILKISKLIAVNSTAFLLALLSYKIAFDKLGSEAFGVFTFSLMLGSFLTSLTDVGISKVASKEIAGSDNPTELDGLIKSFNLIYILAMLIVGLLLPLTAAFFVEHWLNMATSTPVYPLVEFLEILFIANCIFLPLQYLNGIVIGLGVDRLLTIHSFIVPFINYVVWISGFLLFNEFTSIAVFIVLGKFLSLVASLLCILHIGRLNILTLGFDISALKKVREFLYNLTISSVCIIVVKNIDRLLASKILQVDVYGIYDVISQIFGRFSVFLNATFSIYFRSMVKQGKKISDGLGNLFRFKRWINKYLLILYLSPALFASEIILHLFGLEYVEEFYMPVFLLALAYFVNTQTRVLSTYAIIFDRSIIVRKNSITLLLISLLLSPIVYWFGLNGFALYVLLIQIASYINFQFLYSRYILGVLTSLRQKLHYEDISAIVLYVGILGFVYSYELDLWVKIFMLGTIGLAVILLEFYEGLTR